MVEGEKSGLLLLKAILDQSAIDSSIDPDVVRKELAHAYLMFKELKYDVRAFHDWVQRKLNALKQTGHTSTDVATHLLTAYKTSNDLQLRLYIERLEDIARDSGTYLQGRDLMNKVKLKFDSLETARKLEAIATRDDDIVALKAQLEELKKSNGDNFNQSDTKEDDESENEREKSSRRSSSKIPKELKKKKKPSDLTKPQVINGVDWFYCNIHKWCKHQDVDCRKRTDEDDDESSSGDEDSEEDESSEDESTASSVGCRVGRSIKAVGALIAE
jgi:hypothetical protein